jgi:hypothetical protein
MFEFEPAKRITAAEALKHPFFQSQPEAEVANIIESAECVTVA